MKIDVLDKGYVRYDKHMGDDLDVINSAKVSFDRASSSFEEKEAHLLAFLAREEHTSVFRHSAMTLEVYAPLIVARQWWKYVVSSTHIDDQNGWNESSRRYITEQPEFYVPTEWRVAPANKKQGSGEPIEYLPPDMDEDSENWIGWAEFDYRRPDYFHWSHPDPYNALKTSQVPQWWTDDQRKALVEKGPLPKDAHEYGYYWTQNLLHMIDQGTHWYEMSQEWGLAPEQARLFLPAYGLYVRWRWTFSLGAGLHFLHQRLAHDAQSEIREYAEAVKTIMSEYFPHSVQAMLDLI